MKKLFLGSTILITLFTLCITAIRIFNPQHDTLAQRILGTDSRLPDQACWQGICPGTMSIAESVKRFTEVAQRLGSTVMYQPSSTASNMFIDWYAACIDLGDWRSCSLPYYGETKSELRIELTLKGSDLRLGDVMALLGSPDSVFMCAGHVPDRSAKQEGVIVSLQYANGLMLTAYRVTHYAPPVYPTPRDEWIISPDMQVTLINYLPTATNPIQRSSIPFRGFSRGPDTRYVCGR